MFREVCGRTTSTARWRSGAGPTPRTAGHRISLAVAEDGTVASRCGDADALRHAVGGELLIHCVDSMTHPRWRQGLKAKSLFVETCMPFWDHSREIGDALFYGFPVDAACGSASAT